MSDQDRFKPFPKNGDMTLTDVGKERDIRIAKLKEIRGRAEASPDSPLSDADQKEWDNTQARLKELTQIADRLKKPIENAPKGDESAPHGPVLSKPDTSLPATASSETRSFTPPPAPDEPTSVANLELAALRARLATDTASSRPPLPEIPAAAPAPVAEVRDREGNQTPPSADSKKSVRKDGLLDPLLRKTGSLASKAVEKSAEGLGAAGLAAADAVDRLSRQTARKMGEMKNATHERRADRETEYTSMAEAVTPPTVFASLLAIRDKKGMPRWSDSDLDTVKVAIGKRGKWASRWWQLSSADWKLSGQEKKLLARAERDIHRSERKRKNAEKVEQAKREAVVKQRVEQQAAAEAYIQTQEDRADTGKGKLTPAELDALDRAIGVKRLSDGNVFSREDARDFAALMVLGRTIGHLGFTADRKKILAKAREVLLPVWHQQFIEMRRKGINHGKRIAADVAKRGVKVLRNEVGWLIRGNEKVTESQAKAMETGKLRLTPAGWLALNAKRTIADMTPDEQMFLFITGREKNRGIPMGDEEREAYDRIMTRIKPALDAEEARKK